MDIDLPDDLASAVDTMAGQLAVPEKADAAILTWCCRLVARWAAGQGTHGTAVYFVQTGALCSPDDPVPALETGQLALMSGQPHRAESWVRRSVALARRSQQWEAYAGAYLLLGELYHQTGALDRARTLYRRAYRAARRYGLREIGAAAADGVFRLALLSGDEAEAHVYARGAQRACAPNQPAAAAILLRVARFWVDTGRTGDAIPPIRRVLRHLDGLPADQRAGAFALTARVLAGDPQSIARARQAWNQAYALLSGAAPETAVAAALDLVHAAMLLGNPRRAAMARAAALGVAPAREYARVRALLASTGTSPRNSGA